MVPTVFRRVLLTLACLGLTACSGGGGGAASPSGGGPSDFRHLDEFERRYQEIDRLDLTTDMPRSGSARYVGVTAADLHRGASRVGQVTGDVEITVDFAAAAARATEAEALRGRMHNFRGSLDGSEVRFAGELTTSAAQDLGHDSRARVADQLIGSLGADGPGRIGSFRAGFAGELSAGDPGGLVQLEAGGSFRGPGGAGSTGTLSGLWADPGRADPLTVNGRFVIARD